MDHVKDRNLVLKMLQYEDTLIKSKRGQEVYRNVCNKPLVSLKHEYTIQRIVLNAFGFTNDDEAVETYREIFRTYYNSPTDYDKEVLSSVVYMRENKCVYYTSKKLRNGQTIPNVNILSLDGITTVSVYDVVKGKYPECIIALFTNS